MPGSEWASCESDRRAAGHRDYINGEMRQPKRKLDRIGGSWDNTDRTKREYGRLNGGGVGTTWTECLKKSASRRVGSAYRRRNKTRREKVDGGNARARALREGVVKKTTQCRSLQFGDKAIERKVTHRPPAGPHGQGEAGMGAGTGGKGVAVS